MRLPVVFALVVALGTPAVALADPLAGPQTVVEQAGANAGAACRRDTPAADEQCAAVPLTPAVNERAVDAYEQSDVHRALGLQFALGNDLPFARASWLGTHNSFNTTTRTPTLSGLDSNQQLSMTDQLRLDVRSLELDAHWFPSARAGGAYAPVLCHARGANEKHAGCSTEPLLSEGLAEIAAWLRANPRQVLLLYVEDHLETPAGHAQGAAALRAAFGDDEDGLLYAPAGTSRAGCIELPLNLTRNDVLADGKQVVVISGCAAGAGWNSTVFSGEDRATHETGPAGYGEDGTCAANREPAELDSHLLRVFEDATALSATTTMSRNPITPGKADALQRCAVDITGFDQLLPQDGRLAASVWSWAPGEPAATGDCAVQGPDGWQARECGERHAFACRSADGTWSVDGTVTPYAAAGGRCKGSSVATPRYGYEGVQLERAMAAAGASTVWLAYSRTGSTWTPTDTR